jgi:hypothetical protein
MRNKQYGSEGDDLKKGFRFATLIALHAVLAVGLSGCNTVELEDRSFPMLAAVDYEEENQKTGFGYIFPVQKTEPDASENAEDTGMDMVYAADFEEAFWEYEQKLEKIADDNHLKVVLLSTSFIENETEFDRMLAYFGEQKSFPRNAYVCVTPDISAVWQAGDYLSTDLGSYIEELLESHTKNRTKELVTIGELMDNRINRLKDFSIPYLEVEQTKVVLSDVYLLSSEE